MSDASTDASTDAKTDVKTGAPSDAETAAAIVRSLGAAPGKWALSPTRIGALHVINAEAHVGVLEIGGEDGARRYRVAVSSADGRAVSTIDLRDDREPAACAALAMALTPWRNGIAAAVRATVVGRLAAQGSDEAPAEAPPTGTLN